MGALKLMDEKITALMQVMPEEELNGILVYMEEVNKRVRDARQKHLDSIVGKYKDVLSSTEEFMRRKQEEKKLDR